MKILLRSIAVLMILLWAGHTTAVAKPSDHKTDKKGKPAANEQLDPEKDAGYYFLMAEQAQAEGDQAAFLKYYKKAFSLDPSSPYLNARIGSILARNRNIADAIIMVRMAVMFDPKYDEGYTLLGKLYTVTGDRMRALEAYNHALEVKPDDKDLYVLICSLQASQKLYDEAEETMKKMVQRFPSEKQGYFYLGKIYVETEQFDKAEETFKELIEKEKDVAPRAHVELGAVYAVQKQYEKAEEQFRKAIELDKSNLDAQINLANALAAQKKWDEFNKVSEELAKMAPSNFGVQIKMALILASQKQYTMAEKLLHQILKTKPGWDQVRYQLGRVYRDQGKIKEAEAEFMRIRKGAPPYLQSRIFLSLMFIKESDYGKAIKYIDQAIEIDPKDPDIYHIKGTIMEELFRYQDSIWNYHKSLELNPDNLRLRYSLGNVYEKSGRRTLGMEQMEKILVEQPTDAGALNFIGYTLLTMKKDTERARGLIRKALEIKPDDGYIMDSMGWMLFQEGKNEEALKYLQKAMEKVKTDSIIAEHLGDVLMAMGKDKEALEAYKKSAEINSENVIVNRKKASLEKKLGVNKK